GAKLVGGTVNGTGTLLMRAERVGQDTLLAQIVRMVGEAQRSRAPVERLVNRVARYFVPAVLAVAVLTFAAWAAWGPSPRLAHARPAGGFTEDAVLRLAASLERGSEHPLASAIVKGAEARGLPLADARDFQSFTGKGVVGTVEGRRVALGNAALLHDTGVAP